jgi:hypothetical protein
MYKIERKDGRVVISDWNGKIIYGASDDDLVVYKTPVGTVTTNKVSELTDPQLLIALASPVKIAL